MVHLLRAGLLEVLLLIILILLSLSAAADGRLRADFDHGSLYDLVNLCAYHLHLILAVEVALHDLISLNEAIQLPLKLIVLLSEKFLVAVKRIELLSQVIVTLNEGFVALAHAVEVTLKGIGQQVQVFNTLVAHAHTII